MPHLSILVILLNCIHLVQSLIVLVAACLLITANFNIVLRKKSNHSKHNSCVSDHILTIVYLGVVHLLVLNLLPFCT